MYRAISGADLKNNVYQLSFSKIARSGVNGNRIDMEYRFFLIFLINNLLTLLYSPTDISSNFIHEYKINLKVHLTMVSWACRVYINKIYIC